MQGNYLNCSTELLHDKRMSFDQIWIDIRVYAEVKSFWSCDPSCDHLLPHEVGTSKRDK